MLEKYELNLKNPKDKTVKMVDIDFKSFKLICQ